MGYEASVLADARVNFDISSNTSFFQFNEFVKILTMGSSRIKFNDNLYR